MRLLGPSNLALAEDIVHDALISAMQAWGFGTPAHPKAWILQAAKHRAIDLLRRARRLAALMPEPDPEGTLEGAVDVVALNRGLALAELHRLDAGREALALLADDPKLAQYSFFWAALADLERRSARPAEARALYRRAASHAKSRAERLSYERRMRSLEN